MKRFMIAAAALSLAAPAFADQPTTLLEVRKHFAASEDGADGYVFEDGTSGITRAGAEQLARIAAEDETGVDPSGGAFRRWPGAARGRSPRRSGNGRY
jgi:hypothetical protein